MVELRRCSLEVLDGCCFGVVAFSEALRDADARRPELGGARDGLELLWDAGAGGGGIAEVLRLAEPLGGTILCRDLGGAAVLGCLPTGGVLVLEVDALDTPLLPNLLRR